MTKQFRQPRPSYPMTMNPRDSRALVLSLAQKRDDNSKEQGSRSKLLSLVFQFRAGTNGRTNEKCEPRR
jgi:hypothetical protein